MTHGGRGGREAALVRGPARRGGRAEVEAALAGHARVEAWVDPDDIATQRVATWSGLRREGVMRGVTVRRRHRRPDRLRAAGRRPAGPRAGGVPGAAQLLPAAQAGDQPAAGPRPRRPGAAVPADLQAGLGPARRRGRGRRVAAARGRPRGRGGARAASSPPAGCCSPTGCRRGAAGTTRSAWSSTAASTTPRSSTRSSARSARSATRRSARVEEVARAVRRLHRPPGRGGAGQPGRRRVRRTPSRGSAEPANGPFASCLRRTAGRTLTAWTSTPASS